MATTTKGMILKLYYRNYDEQMARLNRLIDALKEANSLLNTFNGYVDLEQGVWGEWVKPAHANQKEDDSSDGVTIVKAVGADVGEAHGKLWKLTERMEEANSLLHELARCADADLETRFTLPNGEECYSSDKE